MIYNTFQKLTFVDSQAVFLWIFASRGRLSCVSEYTSEYVSEYTNKYVSEYTSEYISECTSECDVVTFTGALMMQCIH